ncbi:HU family DNA-binding protein [Acidithiobacillus caldus]|uniref:HU family DNA-binding protein n=1 Tax=Acidithiobacillus caldus TaxID=33059 RepID=UPI0007D94977|nr:HU family DNA-binding protein [Acidithiobacillus caldus]QER44710.1 putative integrase [Acidithiobacillus caldus]
MSDSVVTQADIVDFVASQHGLSKAQSTRIVQSLTDYFTISLANGHRVRLSGIGTLEVHASKERMARNPATGEMVEVPAKRRVRLRVSSELKRAVNA